MRLFERHMGKILVALILVAGAATLLFGYDLRRTLEIDTSPPPVAPHTRSEGPQIPELKPKAHYDLIAKRNIFVFPENAIASKAPSPSPAAEPPKETTLNVSLNGTIVSPTGFAVAFIEDRAKRKEDLYVVGDKVQEAEILDIDTDKVTLRRAGGEEILAMFSEDKRRKARGGTPARAPRPGPSPPTRVGRSASPSQTSSSRQIQQKVRSLMAQLRLRPHFEKGRPSGFKVGQVAKGSVFQAAGLNTGDVIVGINDLDVRTPNQLLKAYREVAEDEDLWFDIVKADGEEDTIDVDVDFIMPE